MTAMMPLSRFPRRSIPQPFAQFNLTRNPFGEFTREQRGELSMLGEDVREALGLGHHQAVQLIGRCGRGKTSHLLGLAARLPESYYVYMPEDGPCPTIATGRPLIIDEAQRLPRRVRRDVFSTGLPLILATHRNLTISLRLFGYQVKTIRVGRKITPAHVRELMNRRIDYCRTSEDAVPLLDLRDAERLVRRFGSNVRAIENYLYDQVQEQAYDHGKMQFTR